MIKILRLINHNKPIVSGVYYIYADEQSEGLTFYRDNNLNDNYKTAFCYSSAISANGQYSYMLQYISTSSDFGVQGNNNNYGIKESIFH